jgi:NAD(P)-dependent dehydrogenase (short-subunit alcohol dehydrogenase family)
VIPPPEHDEQRVAIITGASQGIGAGLVGCLDGAICVDLVDPGRVNIFERWESQAPLETFRSSGPDTDRTSGDAHGVRSGVRHRRRAARVREGGRVSWQHGATLDR